MPNETTAHDALLGAYIEGWTSGGVEMSQAYRRSAMAAFAESRTCKWLLPRLTAREAELLDIIRHYNPDDAIFDGEKDIQNVES